MVLWGYQCSLDILTSIKCFGGFFLMQDVIRLSFFSQPDGPVMGNGTFKTSVLVPGYGTK